MTTKHTAGPWSIRQSASMNYFIYAKNSKEAIAGVKHVYQKRIKDEGLANARLIAAAPDLLAKLQDAERVLRTIRSHDNYGQLVGITLTDEIEEIRAVLAKAEESC